VIVTLAYYPLVYLPVAAVMRGVDPALEESARSLGLGPARTFLRLILPHTRPALLGGALVVAVHLLAEFGAFAMLRFRTFTTAIYDEYRLSFDGPGASMLHQCSSACALRCFVLEMRMRGRGQYARTGPGTVGGGCAHGCAGAAVALLVVRYPSRLTTLLERQYLSYVRAAWHHRRSGTRRVVRALLAPPFTRRATTARSVRDTLLPLAVVAIRAALGQSPPAVEEIAARSAVGRGLRSAESHYRSSHRAWAPVRHWCSCSR